MDVCRRPDFQRPSVLCNGLGQALPRASEATSISSVEFFVFEAILSSKSKSSKETLYGTDVPRDTQWTQPYDLQGVRRSMVSVGKAPKRTLVHRTQRSRTQWSGRPFASNFFVCEMVWSAASGMVPNDPHP